MPDIDDAIQKAMQEGKFDDLPGKGKPLSLDDNPHEDPAWRLAHHVLKSSGYSLPWIETRKEIEAEIAQARLVLQRTWTWRNEGLARRRDDPQIEAEWQRAVHVFSEQVAAINRKIRDYNLQTPTAQVQLRLLGLQAELDQLGQT